jgi:hypothetical protein
LCRPIFGQSALQQAVARATHHQNITSFGHIERNRSNLSTTPRRWLRWKFSCRGFELEASLLGVPVGSLETTSLDRVVSATVIILEEADFAGMNEEWVKCLRLREWRKDS